MTVLKGIVIRIYDLRIGRIMIERFKIYKFLHHFRAGVLRYHRKNFWSVIVSTTEISLRY